MGFENLSRISVAEKHGTECDLHLTISITSPLAELIGNPSIRAPELRHLGYNFAVPGGSAPKISEDLTGILVTPHAKFHVDRSKKAQTEDTE